MFMLPSSKLVAVVFGNKKKKKKKKIEKGIVTLLNLAKLGQF